MADAIRFNIGSAKRLYLLNHTVDGVAETGATVAYTITLADGATLATCTAVAGGSGSLVYAAGTVTIDGVAYAGPNYSGVVTAAVTSLLSEGPTYYVWLTDTVGGALLDTRRAPAYAVARGGS